MTYSYEKAKDNITKDDIMEQIQTYMEPKKSSIDEARANLAAIRKAPEEKNHDATTNEMESTTAREIITPDIVRATIDEAYDAIEEHMLASVPWPNVPIKPKIIIYEWPECARLLKVMKRLHEL